MVSLPRSTNEWEETSVDRKASKLKLFAHALLFFIRVKHYIEYGWDQYLTDPDGGINCLHAEAYISAPTWIRVSKTPSEFTISR